MAHRENKDGKVPLGNEKSPSGTFLPWRENGGQAIHSGRVQNAVSRRRLWLPSKRRKGACNAVMPWCEKTAGEKTLRPSCCNPQFLNSQLNYPVPKREAVHRTLQREPLASGRPFLKQVAQVLHQISPIFEPASISCNDLPRIEYIQRIQGLLDGCHHEHLPRVRQTLELSYFLCPNSMFTGKKAVMGIDIGIGLFMEG